MELFTLEQLQKQFEDGFERGKRLVGTDSLSLTFKELDYQSKSDFHTAEERKIFERAMLLLAETL